MRITWLTEDSAAAVVEYGTSPGVYTNRENGTTSSYKYALYESGNIHDVTIGPLDPNTTYYYQCSSNSARNFSFKTPPAQLPIKFVVIGMYRKKLLLHKKNLLMASSFCTNNPFPEVFMWNDPFLKNL